MDVDLCKKREMHCFLTLVLMMSNDAMKSAIFLHFDCVHFHNDWTTSGHFEYKLTPQKYFFCVLEPL